MYWGRCGGKKKPAPIVARQDNSYQFLKAYPCTYDSSCGEDIPAQQKKYKCVDEEWVDWWQDNSKINSEEAFIAGMSEYQAMCESNYKIMCSDKDDREVFYKERKLQAKGCDKCAEFVEEWCDEDVEREFFQNFFDWQGSIFDDLSWEEKEKLYDKLLNSSLLSRPKSPKGIEEEHKNS